MQKATVNKNVMTRLIVTAARVVLKIRRISAIFTSASMKSFRTLACNPPFFPDKNILEQKIDHIGKYNSPTGNMNPARAAPIHPTTKNFKSFLAKSLARI